MMNGKEKLMSVAGSVPHTDPLMAPGVVPASKGFEMKAGSKGRSSGAALPIVNHVSDGYQLEPTANSGGAEESAEDPGIEEPGEGFEDKPVA